MRDFDFEILQLETQLKKVRKEKEDAKKVTAEDLMLKLKTISDNMFLNLVENSLKERKVENPSTPNKMEIEKIYKVMTGAL
jgi:hypothetical protein